MTETLDSYRARGGFCAFVPAGISHIQTRHKVFRSRSAPCRDWPDGRETEIHGPEVFQVEIVEGRPMCRFSSVQDFKNLLSGNDGLTWEKLNKELIAEIAAASTNDKPQRPY